MKASVSGLLLVALFVLAGWLALATLGGNPVVPADAPADRFSAERALEHLEVIAAEPHPVGTRQIDEVRHYLLAELQALGLEPQIQTTTVLLRRGRLPVAATVHNVMARLEGSGGTGKAVALVSHYDSVPGSPGAGDDGAGVAAVLETLRALQAGEPPSNDVIALFTDAEEIGLAGAAGFVDHHPWAEDVGMVLNFEARGTRGPVLMFETSPGNGSLIAALGEHAERPIGSSYSVEVYRRMPNDTDFTIFRRAGYPGLNFAFIGGGGDYHSAEDTVATLAPETLQQLGDVSLSLARGFGTANLERPWQHRNAVYFNLFGGRGFVRYPGSLVLPLAALLALGVGFVVWSAFRRATATPAWTVAATLYLLVGALVVYIVGALFSPLLFAPLETEVLGQRTSTSLSFVALSLLAGGLALTLNRLVGRWFSLGDRIAGGILLWLLLTLVASFLAPGASFLFALPLLVALPAAWWSLAGESAPGGGAAQGKISIALFTLLALSVVVAALLWIPTVSLLVTALSAGIAGVAAGLLTLVILGLLAQQAALAARTGWALAVGLVVLAVIGGIVIRTSGGVSAVNPARNSIVYVADLDEGTARYFSFDRQPDAWTSQFLGEPERVAAPPFLPVRRPMLSAPAPTADLAPPEIEVIDRSDDGSNKTVELEISWPQRVSLARIVLRAEEDLRITAVDNRPIDPPVENAIRPDGSRAPAALRYYAPTEEGIHLTVETGAETPFEIEAVAQSFELPRGTGFDHDPRPPRLVRATGWNSDSTFWVKKTTLPGNVAPEDVEEEGEAEGDGAGTETGI